MGSARVPRVGCGVSPQQSFLSRCREVMARIQKSSRWRDTIASTRDACATLHNAVAQELVFSGQQILHKSVAAFVCVARCAGKMLIDSHSRRATKIICKQENFIGRFALAEQPLRIRA